MLTGEDVQNRTLQVRVHGSFKELHSVFLGFPGAVLDEGEAEAEAGGTGSLSLGRRAKEEADKTSWWTDRSSAGLCFWVGLSDCTLHIKFKSI